MFGEKVLLSQAPKGSTRLNIALHQAAQSIGNLKDINPSNFFNHIGFRKRRTPAMSATIRILAAIIWR